MLPWYYSLDNTSTLRIRTPAFSTEDEAEKKYYEKLRNRNVSRLCRQILYGTLLLIPVGVIVNSWYDGFQPQSLSITLHFFSYAGTLAGCFILACILCQKLYLSSDYEKEEINDQEESDNESGV